MTNRLNLPHAGAGHDRVLDRKPAPWCNGCVGEGGGVDMRLRVLLVLILVLAVWPRCGHLRAMTVITEESPPFNFIKDGRVTGSSTEVVREILKRLDQPEDIQVLPWARGFHMLQTQPDVALFSTTRIPDRERDFHWVGPLFTVHFDFYARRDASLQLRSLEDAKRVGAIATYKDDVKEALLRKLGFTNLDSSKSPVSNVKKLIAGRVDLWLFDNLGMPDIARQAGVDPIELKRVLPFRTFQSYIAISKQTPPSVVQRWRDALDSMVKDGTFQEISRRWLPPESIPSAGASGRPGRQWPALSIYTEDSPPGNYLQDGRPEGFAVEIVRDILRRLSLPDRIEVVPWARGYRRATSAPSVVLFSTTRLPQREHLFHWVGPIYTQNWTLYGRKGSGLRIDSLEQARKVARIGTYLQDAKEQYLKALGFDNLVSANRNISNIRHLIDGDIDLWVSSDFNMPYQVRQAGVDPNQLAPVYAFRRVDNYIVFSLDTPMPVVRAWQRCLDEIKQDGTYTALMEKFGFHPEAYSTVNFSDRPR